MPPKMLNPTSGAAGRARDEAFDCLVASNGPEITPPHSPVQHPLSQLARGGAPIGEIKKLSKRNSDRNRRYDFLGSGSGEACPDEAGAAAIDRWTADILKRSGHASSTSCPSPDPVGRLLEG